MFLVNCWYVAGWSAEFSPGDLLSRRILNQAIVLFRTQDGIIGALEDRCYHRAVPLSIGRVDGNIIRCSYHGMEYDVAGRCVKIPSQDAIPQSAKVRRYPSHEQDALIWIWMGDQDAADIGAIPRQTQHNDPKWGWKSDHYHVDGNWQLLIDNLMDLSHLPYIHPHTIGGDPETHFRAAMNTRRTEKSVSVQRHMPNSMPPPTYVAAKGFTGQIDRWQEIEFQPVVLRIHTGGCDAGTGAYDGKREHGFSMLGFHAITPESEHTTHYFWSIATNILKDGVLDLVFEQTGYTFCEDQEVLEVQQRRIDDEPLRPLLDIKSDAGGNHVRRWLKELIYAEAKSDIRA
jgi:phenylpropionate dioxygenase-like ring-hydroxylating dioxygenase large terminal subunit